MIVLCVLATTAMTASRQATVAWRPAFEIVQPEVFSDPGGQTVLWTDVGDSDLDLFVGFNRRPIDFI